jgi:flagellar biosynthesis/type III secretory pathway M-ring protein FliF/YscJ
VTSIPFSESISSENQMETGNSSFDFMALLKDYKKTIINLFLLVAVFFVLVKPLLNALKNMPREAGVSFKELPSNMQPSMQLSGGNAQGKREKVLEMGRSNPEKAEQLIKGWISE